MLAKRKATGKAHIHMIMLLLAGSCSSPIELHLWMAQAATRSTSSTNDARKAQVMSRKLIMIAKYRQNSERVCVVSFADDVVGALLLPDEAAPLRIPFQSLSDWATRLIIVVIVAGASFYCRTFLRPNIFERWQKQFIHCVIAIFLSSSSASTFSPSAVLFNDTNFMFEMLDIQTQ